MKVNCKICNSKDVPLEFFNVKEMMTGTRDQFTYFRCANCGTLQIEEILFDMSKYYDKNYYSFSINYKTNWLLYLRNRYGIRGKGIVGFVLNKIFPTYLEHSIVGSYLLNDNTSFLDVGCGNGDFIKLLHDLGFDNLTGIDPFLLAPLKLSNNSSILNLSLHKLSGQFKVIRMHHVFEHVPNPDDTFKKLNDILADDGTLIVTIPIVGIVYKEFKEHSYVIQAPHHFFLYTEDSLIALANRYGLIINKVIRNPLGLQNWLKISKYWSENIANPEIKNGDNISKRDKKKFSSIENHAIKNNLGDNVTFVFKKIKNV
jgi:2-polyprenyl-3-methyl-5-hydroxy-6-metoxy-1,4-benzoquinol methylase